MTDNANIAKTINDSISRLTVIDYPIEDLKPYAKNSKIHDKNQINRLAATIESEGLQESLIIEPDGTIVAGHGRFAALKQLGWVDVPVRIMKGYTPAQIAFVRISSNQTVSNKYDSLLQREELDELLKSAELSTENIARSTGLSERDLEVLLEDVSAMSLTLDDLNEPDLSEEKTQSEDQEYDQEPVVVEKGFALQKIFGFSEVTGDQSRQIKQFLAVNEIEDAESFANFCAEYLMAAV